MECELYKNKVINNNIEKLILDIRFCINKYLKDEIKGFYLFGSLFNGDYNERISDIDFIAIINNELDEKITEKVYYFFKNLKKLNLMSEKLEGSFTYIPKEDPWSLNNSIWKEKNCNIVVEKDVLDPDVVDFIVGKGYTVYGSKPQKIFPYVSAKRLITFSENYIARIIDNIDEYRHDPIKLYNKLLNACRSAYFICNGNFAVRKTLAAKWVMEKYPEYAHIIKKALYVRENPDVVKAFSTSDINTLIKLLNLVRSNNLNSQIGFNKPMKLEIQMTTKCNCNCPQCGYFTINKKDNISEHFILDFMSTAKKNWGWIDRVLFEGGEPTMDFEKLVTCIKNAKSLNIPNIQINSNFIDLDFEKITTLVNAGCNYFEVSVDGITTGLWSMMRGITDNDSKRYERFINNLSIACNMPGVVVDFNFTPTKLNIKEFNKVYEMACELGARYFSFQNLVCTTQRIKELEVTNDILIQNLRKCNVYAERYACPPTILLCCLEAMDKGNELLNQNTISEQYKCTCGNEYLYINHKGEMRMCCFGDGLVLGPYNRETFDSIWNKKKQEQFTGCPVISKKLKK